MLDEIVKTSHPLVKDSEKKVSPSVDIQNLTCYWDKVRTTGSTDSQSRFFTSSSLVVSCSCRFPSSNNKLCAFAERRRAFAAEHLLQSDLQAPPGRHRTGRSWKGRPLSRHGRVAGSHDDANSLLSSAVVVAAELRSRRAARRKRLAQGRRSADLRVSAALGLPRHHPQ